MKITLKDGRTFSSFEAFQAADLSPAERRDFVTFEGDRTPELEAMKGQRFHAPDIIDVDGLFKAAVVRHREAQEHRRLVTWKRALLIYGLGMIAGAAIAAVACYFVL